MSSCLEKISSFVAHNSSTNCISLGRKSGVVFATGGEDCKVNLWRVGKAANILSFGGHKTAIECLSFDRNELVLCSGSRSGVLKLWDLAGARLQRNLKGHRSACTSVNFHVLGDFLMTGSLDSNVKVWDYRRSKRAIQTYKGHEGAVNSVICSPDGRWIVSGGEDCTARLWDLTAGKEVKAFRCRHLAGISDLVFHPTEFLLASASEDRTAKLWDMEDFSLIQTTPSDTGGLRRLCFSPDGDYVVCGSNEQIRVWNFDPPPLRQTVSLRSPVKNLQDIHALKESDDKGRFILCGSDRCVVSVWLVDMELEIGAQQKERERLSRRALQKKNLRMLREKEKRKRREKNTVKDGKPERVVEEVMYDKEDHLKSDTTRNAKTSSEMKEEFLEKDRQKKKTRKGNDLKETKYSDPPNKRVKNHPSLTTPRETKERRAFVNEDARIEGKVKEKALRRETKRSTPWRERREMKETRMSRGENVESKRKSFPGIATIPSRRNGVIGINYSDFLPTPEKSVSDVFDLISDEQFKNKITQRREQIMTLGKRWDEGNVTNFIAEIGHVESKGDYQAILDCLGRMELARSQLTLDNSTQLLRLLLTVLNNCKNRKVVAIQITRSLVALHADLVIKTLGFAQDGRKKPVNFDERLRRCEQFREAAFAVERCAKGLKTRVFLSNMEEELINLYHADMEALHDV